MLSPRSFRHRLVAQALLLPLALALAASAEEAASGGKDTGASAPSPAPAASPKQAEVSRGITGVILALSEKTIAVRNLAEGSRGTNSLTLAANADTRVTGLKKSFAELRQGDFVAIAYQGTPPTATGIQVLPPNLDGQIAAALGLDPYHKQSREFIGWIKRIDAHTMVVRTPDGPPASRRKGEVKTFVRQPDTKVEMLRSSWDELKKGDRVVVDFDKGEPRPAERVQVILRGGEKPLPPGLATRLFDRAYDQSVKDVDGIGEWPPGVPWPPQNASAAPGAGAAPTPAPAPAH
jgi:hypothetical protein